MRGMSRYRALLDQADPGSLARGERYAAEHRVRILHDRPDGVAAVVSGTTEYDVTVSMDDGSCTCPVGMRGEFCKHLVAVVMHLEDGGVTGAQTAQTDDTLHPHTASWLQELDADQLRDVIWSLARSQDAAAALDAMATAETGDVSMLGPVVDSLRTRGHLDYRRANRHGEDAHEVVDQLEALLSPTTADAMLPLIERAIDLLVRTILRSDDSSGIQSGAVGRLLSLHEDAAQLGSPDPLRLARWMAKLGFAEHGFFDVDPVPYAEALGDRGLAAYRRSVDKRLTDDPGDFAARRAAQRLAVLQGDVEQVVELVGGPLDRPYYFQQLVDALLEIGAEEEALRYAVRGLTVSPVSHLTIPLYDTAVRMLRERGDIVEALRLRKQQFQTFPTEVSYGSLRRAAKEASSWETERLAALDVLLERNPRAWLAMLLSEGETDLAWDASRDMDLDPAMARMLLRARAKERPADVFEGYVELIDHLLGPADRQAYAQAIAELAQLRRACEAGDRGEDYDAYVAELLERHRRRPTLVTMLRRLPSAQRGAGWGP
jgi:uncharacterized Zn finger protein